MRNIINISLPEPMVKIVKREVRQGSYASVSEFIRDTIRSWMEEKQLRELNESRKEMAEGKGKVLRSLRDLR